MRLDAEARQIKERDGWTCQYCGKQTKKLSIDHVIPKAASGPEWNSNKVACCYRCNRLKGDTEIVSRYSNRKRLKRVRTAGRLPEKFRRFVLNKEPLEDDVPLHL